ETACVVGINRDPVTIKNVEVAIIDKAWDEHRVLPQPPEWHTGKTVAVVGSGPAGLAAAQQLTRAGHTVAVFERSEEPGGLLRFGIPEFKMEKYVLDRRIRQMKDEGTNFRCGVTVGGGDTGADCLGTSIRQGAKTITQLEILPTPPDERPPAQPWPTYPMIYRVSSAHEEAGQRVYSVSTSEFVGTDGRVTSLRL